MVRTQIQLPKEDLTALQEMAAEQGVSVSEIVRRGIKRVLEEKWKPTREELLKRALSTAGIAHSGLPDVAQRHDDYLAEAYEE